MRRRLPAYKRPRPPRGCSHRPPHGAFGSGNPAWLGWLLSGRRKWAIVVCVVGTQVPGTSLVQISVTVITPVYNGAPFIEETVRSVLEQGYEKLQYIVLDDGSTDGTLDVLRRFEGRIIIDSHANMGETRTVNRGLAMAEGDVVAVVNADDPLLPGAIAAAVEALHEDEEALLAYPDWLEIDEHSKALREVRLPDYCISNMLETFDVSMGPGVFIRRRALALAGLRDESFRYAGDLELWFRLALHGRFIHIPRVLATHRVHGGSASVSAKGPRMASEIVEVATRTLDSPLCASNVSESRDRILGRVHFAASFFCGGDWRARLRYLWISCSLDPGLVPMLLYTAMRKVVPKPVRNFAKRALGREPSR